MLSGNFFLPSEPGASFFRRAQTLNTDGIRARSFGQVLHLRLVGRSEQRQVKIAAYRLVMSFYFVQDGAGVQTCLCNQQINHEGVQRV
jgi:hypothetical protein